jgi:hypothetical protein
MEAFQEIAYWLARLGQEYSGPVPWEILAGGLSGCCTYRLTLPTGGVVLKTAREDSPDYVIGRARREVAFYRSGALAVPLMVPQMLACCDEAGAGCALLLCAYAPTKEAHEWQQQDYRELTKQLACFHAMFWNQTERLAEYAWLRPLPEENVAAERHSALTAWQKLWQAHPQALAGRTHTTVVQALEQTVTLRQELCDLPLTLCHNDCHIGNLLSNNGSLLWADWQEVGIGYGPNDLSFLYQRADTPPDRMVVRSYQEQLERETGHLVPFEAIWRGVVTSELWTRLIHWPHYLLEAPEERVHYHLQRIEALLQSV